MAPTVMRGILFPVTKLCFLSCLLGKLMRAVGTPFSRRSGGLLWPLDSQAHRVFLWLRCACGGRQGPNPGPALLQDREDRNEGLSEWRRRGTCWWGRCRFSKREENLGSYHYDCSWHLTEIGREHMASKPNLTGRAARAVKNTYGHTRALATIKVTYVYV